ncbi:hypothetical protein [Spirosoma pomorum]
MRRTTVTGSLLAMILPATVAKHFLENASQEEVNKAEQEAAVLHGQLQSGIDTPPAGQPVAQVPPTVPPAAPAVPPVTTPAAPVAQLPLETTAPTGDLQSQLTAMTSRATNAESTLTSVNQQLASVTAERDNYKSWYQKIQGVGTTLPIADASNRGQNLNTEQPELSAATSAALQAFQNRKKTA